MNQMILVIEDDPTVRKNLVLTLQMEGFKVHAEDGGLAGLHAARNLSPDIILCDITMNEFDGYQVLESVRADKRLASTPFIFLTAKSTMADLRSGMQRGADDYLPKPFTAEELIAAIHTRLARSVEYAVPRGQVPSPRELEALGLTPREAEVLHWLTNGKTNSEIAIILGIGVATVKTHVIRILEKLQVENRAGAMLRVLGEN